MDAGQLQQILTAFTHSQAEMLRSVVDTLQSHGGIQSTFNFEAYDPKTEKFSCYLERFENQLAIRNITDDAKKCQHLNGSIGAAHYNNLVALLGPGMSLKLLAYKDLKARFTEMLSPKRSAVVVQHCFLNTKQKDSENIATYVSSLQRDLSECNFEIKCTCGNTVSAAPLFLRAQFLRGISDDYIREQLLQTAKPTQSFNDLVQLATAIEGSKIETRVLTQPTPNSSSTITETPSINRLGSRKSNQPSRNQQNSNHHRKQDFQPKQNKSKHQNASRGRLDFRTLGIDGLCLKCGEADHKAPDCRKNMTNTICHSCKKTGHISKVCITTLRTKLKKPTQYSNINNVSNDHFSDVFQVVDIYNYETTENTEKFHIDVLLNGKKQNFEVDSGAGFTLLSISDHDTLNLNLQLQPTNIVFRDYNKNLFRPLGKANVMVQCNGRRLWLALYVVPQDREPIIGRAWIRSLHINLLELDNILPDDNIMDIKGIDTPKLNDLLMTFTDVFEEKIGCIPNYKVKFQLHPGVKPCYTKERSVPYALRQKVENELDRLEKQGIITPIKESSDWGSPLVIIPKDDGTVRLCVDYKVGVNKRLTTNLFPIPKVTEILNRLRNSKFFCKLDIHKAYLHLAVDDESSKIQAITTHRGTYTMNRLSFGTKVAPAEFNRIMSQITKGLKGVEIYFDDFLVHGIDERETLLNLQTLLERLREYNIHLNQSKCIFLTQTIEYLGHTIEYNKIRKSAKITKAITDMPRPHNADAVRRFLGLITYYSRFVPNLSEMSTPLRRLLQIKRRFFWSKKCKRAFVQLKKEICSDRVLIPFSPDLPVILTTDASPRGIAAVISHMEGDKELPIAYASRSLKPAELSYSQLDREALAILFGVTRFFDYLYGTHFTLFTDNQALTRIFHSEKGLPSMTSARLLRYAAFLSSFDYTVKFKKGSDNTNVDCLSRAPLLATEEDVLYLDNEVYNIFATSIFTVTGQKILPADIVQETNMDPELGPLKKKLLTTAIDSEFTLCKSIIFKDKRIVIPTKLQCKILEELHSLHLGVTKMKQLARRYVTWKGIDKDITNLVSKCQICADLQKNPKKVPVHPWTPLEKNWERIHIDYAEYGGTHHLLCIDAKSQWLEVRSSKTSPTTESTIQNLESIFAIHGYPEVMVSDKATIFTSAEFDNYCKTHGIFQKFIAPGHAATNGLAERNVQTFKRRLKSLENQHGSLQDKINEILLWYRATPLQCGKSPAEQYLGRHLRLRLDAIRPMIHLHNPVPNFGIRSFVVGERVQIRRQVDRWLMGTITEILGTRHYLVTLDTGRIIKGHINQLRRNRIQQRTFPTTISPSKNNACLGVPKTQPIVQASIPNTPDTTLQSPGSRIPVPVSPRIRRSERARKCPDRLEYTHF